MARIHLGHLVDGDVVGELVHPRAPQLLVPRHAEQAELARQVAEAVDVLLHGVADEHQRVDLALAGLANGMAEDLPDLRLPAEAAYAGHQPPKLLRIHRPAARPAFPEAAVVEKLHLKPAERRGFGEHLALDMTGPVPGRLAARRGIHREDETPSLSGGLAARRGGDLVQKLCDFAVGRLFGQLRHTQGYRDGGLQRKCLHRFILRLVGAPVRLHVDW